MKGWDEKNFLEELMPPLGRRPAADRCPEVEALRAVADGEASENLKGAIAAHTAGCPTCRDFQQRLQAFDAPMLNAEQTEWKRTEGRLDNWLKSFLDSEGAVYQVGRCTRESLSRPWWKRMASLHVGWQVRWILVPAATFGVVICSFLVGRLSAPRPRQLAVVTPYGSSSPNPIPGGAVAEARSPESRPAQESQPSQYAHQSGSNPAVAAAAVASAQRRIRPSSAATTASPRSANATGTAILTPPASSKSEEASISSPPEPRQNPTETSAPVAPHAQAERTVESAEASGPPPSLGPRPGPRLSARPMPAGMRSAVATRSAAALAVRAEHTPVVLAPPLIRLDAGTRVWISLKSIQPLTDGVSEFRGVVLLPVTQSSAVLLVRNTEVFGTVPVRNGKRSVQIREFLSAEAHYRLRSAGGEANLRLLGAGEVVEFDAGKVLETWMATESTYEKLPAESRPPE